MSKIMKAYNKQYRTKMIKIEQYKLDPAKEGHELLVSWKANKRKPPIIDGDDFVRPPRPPRKSLDERIAEALTVALKPIVTRLDGIEKILQEHGNNIEQLSQKLDRVVTLNDLKS